MQELFSNQWVVYVLRSMDEKHKNKTYVGSTNNIKRRIRQHNREIKGGAKITGMHGPYEIYCIISGFTDRKMALKCEWLMKHPTGTMKNDKYYGVRGRIKGLNFLLTKSEKWKERSNNVVLDIYLYDNEANCIKEIDICNIDNKYKFFSI